MLLFVFFGSNPNRLQGELARTMWVGERFHDNPRAQRKKKTSKNTHSVPRARQMLCKCLRALPLKGTRSSINASRYQCGRKAGMHRMDGVSQAYMTTAAAILPPERIRCHGRPPLFYLSSAQLSSAP